MTPTRVLSARGPATFALALGLALAPGLAAQQPRPLEIDDLFRLDRVGSPVVSPDGAWVAYTVTRTSLADEESTTRVWMSPFEGGDPLEDVSVIADESRPRTVVQAGRIA